MPRDLLRFLTCGGVDDGKSTLIGRLLHDTKMVYEDQLAAVKRDSARFAAHGRPGAINLALLTDGLRAEREQGITIDVAYRSFATDRRRFIIADTPGHEQYTRNMVTGASTCRLAVILVDARHGVVTQTRRHSFVVSLLGIKHVVVAINKMDLVGYSREVFERIKIEYAAFAAKLDVPDVRFIPVAALDGDNVVDPSGAMPWYGGPTLLHHLETVEVGAAERDGEALRFPVQYVIRPGPDFRGFAGTIAAGVLRRGDEVVALPSGRRSRVASIVTADGERDEAVSEMAVTVTLEDEIDVCRGDMLVHPRHRPSVSTHVEAMVVWMADTPLEPGRTYWIKHTTRTVVGTVTDLRYGVDVATLERRPATALAANEVGHIVLTLTQPIVYDPYRINPATGAFIIIDRMTNGTVGAGMILGPVERQGAGGPAIHEPVAQSASHPATRVSPSERETRFGQRGATVLMSGRTGPETAAIAYALERELFAAGRAVMVLDGPALRADLSRDLGVTAADDREHLRRSAEVARILTRAGMIGILAFVAADESAPEAARDVLGADRTVTVALSARAEVRRPRGPGHADLELPAHEVPVAESVARIVAALRRRGVID